MSSRSFSASTALEQIGRMNLMAMGARDYVSDEPNGMVMFRVLAGGRTLDKVIVTLDADDTYSVRFVRMRKPAYDVEELGSAHGVYAEELGETCYRLTHGLGA
jgi:hypothetical protein